MKRFSTLAIAATLIALQFTICEAQEVLLPLQGRNVTTAPAKSSASALQLPFFDDFAASGATSPDATLWENGGATVGCGYGELPPTVGMATLDALGPNGRLYPQATTSAFPADTLCSLPLRLDSVSPADSLVFSFFYLPGGGYGNLWERVGDTPDDSDSLYLDFFRPSDSTWLTVWARGGTCIDTLIQNTGKAWQYVAVAVSDPAFFDSAFRFRFRNHCSLEGTTKPGMSGNCDQWNIDYVLLDTGRSVIAEPHWRDLAFVSPAPSMLGSYRAMPARQYRTSDMASSIPLKITNLFDSELASHFGYTVLDDAGDTVASYDGGFENAPTGGYQTAAAHANPHINFSFPESDNSREYTIVHVVREGVGGDNHGLNDTIRFKQVFSDYYAYDDGSAENGYGITSTASRIYLAYRFDLNLEDTLTAVDFCFNTSYGGGNESIQFYITIWQTDENGQPGTVLYRDSERRYPTVGMPDQFTKYILEEAVIVSGSIFVGLEQVGNNYINIGFDRNTQNADKIWYLTSTEWQQSILSGSLMIRPRFGAAASLGIANNDLQPQLKVFPNPANGIVYIDNMPAEGIFSLYDISGRKVLTGRSNTIETSVLSQGLYLLRIVSTDGTTYSTKLQIIH